MTHHSLKHSQLSFIGLICRRTLEESNGMISAPLSPQMVLI